MGYDLDQILVQSVDLDRCIQTAQALLDGLFPENLNETESHWNLVPIHSISKAVDNVFKNI